MSNNVFEPFDYITEIRKGNIDGSTFQNLEGRNPNVGAITEDVSSAGSLSKINYDAETGTFTAGLVVTGGTSLATAVIVIVDDNGSDGSLTIRKIAGTFEDNETITDTSTGSATSDGLVISLGGLNLPTSGQQWEFVSESTDDDIAGVGARQVFIEYLDFSHNIQTLTIDLDGHTPALSIPTDCYRFRVGIITNWGSNTMPIYGGTNLGTIVIRDTASKDVIAVIVYDDNIVGDEHGNNSTSSAAYTVPAGKTALLISIYFNTSKNHQTDISIWNRDDGTTGFIKNFDISVYQNSAALDADKLTPRIGEKVDLKVLARSNNTSVDVNVRVGLIEVDNV